MTLTDAEAERVEVSSGSLTLVGDRRRAVDERGVVVLLHGGGQTRHSWDRAAREICDLGWTAVTVDLRGHGDSDWAVDGDYSIDAFASDAAEVARSFVASNGDLPVLVGASLGGVSSLLAEAERGPLARALVLVDIAPRVEPAGIDRIRAFMNQAPEGFADLDEVADAVAVYQPHRIRPRDVSGLRRNVRERPDGRLRWHWDPAFGGHREERDDPAILHSRLTLAASRVDVPTLLVRGGDSDVVSQEGVDELRRVLRHGRFSTVEGSGHMVAGDDNAVFLQEVAGLLEDLAHSTPDTSATGDRKAR